MAADGGAVARRELSGGVFKLRRSQVVRRRIDEVASQRHAFDDALEIVAIDALRQIERDVSRFGFAVAREAVEAESESERGKARVVRLVGKPVGAVRQKLRQTPGEERVLDVVWPFEAEQDSAKPGFARQQQMLAGFGLETRRVREGAGLSADTLAHVGIGLRGDEPDRNRAPPFRVQQKWNPLRPASTRADNVSCPPGGSAHVHGMSEAWITSGTPSPPTDLMARSTSLSPKRWVVTSSSGKRFEASCASASSQAL